MMSKVTSLASDIAMALSAAINFRGFALFAVDGSGSNSSVFDQLSQADIAWDRVVVVVKSFDIQRERMRCPNIHKIRDQILSNNAIAATFLPSQYEGITPLDVASIMSADASPLLPIDVFVSVDSNCNPLSRARNNSLDTLKYQEDGRASLFYNEPVCSKGNYRCVLSEIAQINARTSFLLPSSPT